MCTFLAVLHKSAAGRQEFSARLHKLAPRLLIYCESAAICCRFAIGDLTAAQVIWKPTQSCMIALTVGQHTHIHAKKILKVERLLKFVAGVHNCAAACRHKFAVISRQISLQSKYLATFSQFAN
jgi:hypothetical protein